MDRVDQVDPVDAISTWQDWGLSLMRISPRSSVPLVFKGVLPERSFPVHGIDSKAPPGKIPVSSSPLKTGGTKVDPRRRVDGVDAESAWRN